jgi:putative Mn2+ efflux pump MntP
MPPDEDDELLVPAGFFRVILGLTMMVGGFLLAALAVDEWIRTIGGCLFLVSGTVMLKNPNKGNK